MTVPFTNRQESFIIMNHRAFTLAACAAAGMLSAAAPPPVDFNREIRPIMSDTCFRCHGPDKSSRMMGMRLDLRDEATKPLPDGHTPIVPGDPDQSEIIKRIFEPNPAKAMPPLTAHKTLTTAQKETIRRWIAEGAKYQGHWAYEPIKRPAVPELATPQIVNPIDNFIQEKLAKEGSHSFSRSRPPHSHPPRHFRSHWPASHSRRSGSFPKGQISRRL